MKKKKSAERRGCVAPVGEELVTSLTRDQIAVLLDVVLSGTDLSLHAEELRKADSDMAETVARVLGSSCDTTGKAPGPRIASDKKLVEMWAALWSRWSDAIFELGDEDGRYVMQEAHWEPPYFDGSALANDIDKIAAEMLDLIDDVFPLVENPDLFTEALGEIDSGVLSYPEWMLPGDPCFLESTTTRCVLKWLWLASGEEDEPAKSLLGRAILIEDDYDMVVLNSEETAAFFAELPEPVCRGVYEGLQDARFESRLGRIRSTWHTINHTYEERFDTNKYLESCRSNLVKNWRYGKPLIDDALAKGDPGLAESLLEQTMASFLHRDAERPWRPETSLLIAGRGYFYAEGDTELLVLLDTWARVSDALHNRARSAASQFQSATCRAPEKWAAVISKFKKLQSQDTASVLTPLFREWQNEMAIQSLPAERCGDSLRDTWIHWLIDAQADSSGQEMPFTRRLENWLGAMRDNGDLFDLQWQQLARLTIDLPGNESLRKEYPTFCKIVLPDDRGKPILRNSRRRALRSHEVGPCIPVAMSVWKNWLWRIVPDPAEAHRSDYMRHADWMKALLELSTEAYERLLNNWRETHKRRRNLWRDLAATGLPL